MSKQSGKAARITVSALAVALLLSGLSLDSASAEETLELGTENRTQLKAEGPSTDPVKSAAPITAASAGYFQQAERSSIVLSPSGDYYLADQLLLRTRAGESAETALAELNDPPGTELIGGSEESREYQVLLPHRYSRGELQQIAQRWQHHPSVESAELNILLPIDEQDA